MISDQYPISISDLICALSISYSIVVFICIICVRRPFFFISAFKNQVERARREGMLLRLTRNNLISLLLRCSRFHPPGIIKTHGSFLRLMPADMAISSAPALTGEKCQVSPRRRDRGVNDILSNYLSPLHRPGIGTWRDHMRQAITWKKILITVEVEHTSHSPPSSKLPPNLPLRPRPLFPEVMLTKTLWHL